MDNFKEINEKNLQDHLIVSDFETKSFDDTELCLGIDEAGRGPVLGPMVYAALFCPIDKEQQLKEMECADSKALTEKDREKIFKKLNEANDFCGYAIKILSPHTISTNMLKRVKYNLNEISHDSAIALIDKLYNEKQLNIKQVFLDTVGDATKYEQKLMKRFPKLKIKVSKKADSLYPCVSAASICAKVTRDSILKNWVFNEKLDMSEYGSGYPGDPLTRKFLDTHINQIFGFVKLVRFSWSTAANKLKKSCVQIKWSDLSDEEYEDNEVEEIVEDAGENEKDENTKAKPVKKEAKKPAKSKPSKLSLAVVSEKNNGSILNFFQKSQKRPIASENSSDVDSQFLISRNLKICKVF